MQEPARGGGTRPVGPDRTGGANGGANGREPIKGQPLRQNEPRPPMMWGHDDRNAPTRTRPQGQGPHMASNGRADQVDRWQRDMFPAAAGEAKPDRRMNPIADERRKAFANFEW